ncbi:MAG: rhodanese-like domain-containing protein [Endozoicomonadaceae bacterium]|nr:rhodanese-like domain-containing protein [Endozoicomonadaceae bacterium]MCY4329380.1 rhodanese-like domain-containing protein [Endozoicomonadaceae bacterium]
MEKFILFAAAHPILVGIFVVLLILLIITENQKGGKTISNIELTQLVNRDDTAVIIDLRDSKSFKAGHITQAINVPHATLKQNLQMLDKYKESPVILVCDHGQHSGSSGQILSKSGFAHILRLRGGIHGWSGENLPLVRS